jgi:hypothetical protein
MVLNVSEDGLAISMAIPVGDTSYSSVNVRMNGLPKTIELPGRMVWTTKSKKRAGIQLSDIDEMQRQQIREWIALEGLRDVNLVPRATLEDHSHAVPVVTAGAINPMVFAEPRTSLLDAFGGTPEFLAPAPTIQEDIASEQAVRSAESLLGFEEINSSGFRDKEWDLAAVTMVPRKRPRPEGLSAIGLVLLWIAIPAFGIGILVGRRPLEQWLAGVDSPMKTIPATSPRRDQILSRPEPMAVSEKIETGATDNARMNGDALAATKSAELKSADADRSDDLHGTDVAKKSADANLLNSMSTQEARAYRNTKPVLSATNVDSSSDSDNSDLDRRALVHDSVLDAANNFDSVEKGQHISLAPALAPVASTPAVKASSRDSSVPLHTTSPQRSYVSSASKTNPVDSGWKAPASKSSIGGNAHPAPSNMAASTVAAGGATTSVPSSPIVAASSSDTTQRSQNSAVPASTYSTPPNQKVTGSASVNSTVPNQSPTASGSAYPSASNQSVSASSTNSAAPRQNSTNPGSSSISKQSGGNFAGSQVSGTDGGTNAAPSHMEGSVRSETNTQAMSARWMGSGGVASGAISSNPSASTVVPSSASPSLASISTQPPLHGAMMVARRGDESFLLSLPVESVVSSRTGSVRMQRFVNVPGQARWHHRGPIAKLEVGELLTKIGPVRTDPGVTSHAGDVVTVRAYLDKNGNVEDLKPLSGRSVLVPHVMHAVRQWQFDRTLVDGKPVEAEVNVTVEFRPNP